MSKDEIEIGNELQKRIGAKIRKIRKDKGHKNYEAFAKKFNFNKVTIQRIESGHDFKISNLIKLLSTFEITLSDFFKDFD